MVLPTTAFGCSGATIFAAFFAVASVFAGAFAADFLRALVSPVRALPAALDRLLRAARASFFLPAPFLGAFAGFLRFAACLRFLAMGNSYSIIDVQKTMMAGT